MIGKDPAKLFMAQAGRFGQSVDVVFAGMNKPKACFQAVKIVAGRGRESFQKERLDQADGQPIAFTTGNTTFQFGE